MVLVRIHDKSRTVVGDRNIPKDEDSFGATEVSSSKSKKKGNSFKIKE